MILTSLGARSEVKLIPRYVWDSEERRPSEQERKLSESSLYFSPMNDQGPRVFNRIMFAFADLKGIFDLTLEIFNFS